MPGMAENQMNAVFTAVLSQNMRKFPENIRSLAGPLATAINEVHSLAKNMCSQSELLPQLFTNKDAWRVLDSISLITDVKESEEMIKLCYHECKREFEDKISDPKAKGKFSQAMREVMKKVKGKVNLNEDIVFVDYMSQQEGRRYQENPSREKLVEVTQQHRRELQLEGRLSNACNTLHYDACEQVAKMARVLRQSSGNILLVGSKGQGKKSLAKIASHIMDFRPCETKIAEKNLEHWRSFALSSVLENQKTALIMEVEGQADKGMA